ncbi:MAG: glutamine synthetase type III, partial [Planctomycetes bacterium]|nr:glutamine synthetase type III [Planctomycetota bacterium]
PAIISIFLGRHLEEVVDVLLGGDAGRANGEGGSIQLGVTTLPNLPRDTGDRNRTSPFAFTGNKFEFRAVGSSQSPAYPATVLNTIVAQSVDYLASEIARRAAQGDQRLAIQEVVRETLARHKRILFSGDNYSEEWRAEAERRGLPNLKDAPSAIDALGQAKNLELFDTMKVLSPRETESRQAVMYENYAGSIRIEAVASLQIGRTMILPVGYRCQSLIAKAIRDVHGVAPDLDLSGQREHLQQITTLVNALKCRLDDLESLVDELDGQSGGHGGTPGASLKEQSVFCRDRIIPCMNEVRKQADGLEAQCDDEMWPLPKYREILILH